tara:strand:+ start:109 stop:981 length:873 start_codon:yes stop_codon:yes gene_type:complete
MAKKDRKKRPWIQKLLNRYRLVVINEKTFEERFYFRLSRLSIIIIVFLFISLITIAAILSIAYSPLKEFIPGYTSTRLRKNAIENSFALDSISRLFQKQDRYIKSIKSALKGEVEWDSISKINDNSTRTNESINLPETEVADSILRAEVLQEDKYNVVENPNGNVKFLLYPPAKGPISQGYNPELKHFAIDVVLEKNTPIKSVAEGTVIFSEWSAETGYVIIVEHAHDLLTVYKHNSSLNKEQGDIVSAGEVIASAGNTGELSTGWHLHFELWANGYPMDPTNFIDFSEE